MVIAAIAVSCSNDDSSSLGQGNSVQAGFVLSLEDRLATRAISDVALQTRIKSSMPQSFLIVVYKDTKKSRRCNADSSKFCKFCFKTS